ncbi:DUF3552 domain-containing protein, partial [candidate division KSB1 bacterium]|nr:DUF3552 domain-containing protein [candidate division KSB1 bacterium]
MTSLWIYVVVAATAFVLAWLLAKFTIQQKLARNKSAAADIIAQAEKEAERKRQQFLVQAKQEWFRERDGQEQKLKQRLRMAEENDQRLDDREKKLNRREDSLKQRESALAQRESELENYKLSLKTKDAELERLISAQNLELSKITQLSLEEAKQRLMENLRQEFNKDAAEIYKSIVDEAKANAT